MVGAGRGGIIAVIGGDDQDIIVCQGIDDFRQTLVKFSQCVGVSLRIVTVAEFGVEIY